MSSFINTPKHFQSIKQGLTKLIVYQSNDFHMPYSLRDIARKSYKRREYFIEDIEKEIETLVQDFFELQILCVTLQYKHHYENCLDTEIKTQLDFATIKEEPKELNNIGLLKAINCAFYQVETEHLKELRELTRQEQNALTFFTEMKTALMEHIIYHTEDWENSDWSI